MRDQQTIFALSSGGSSAALQVIRISGDKVGAIMAILCPHKKITPRTAHMCALYDETGELIDKAIMVFFPKPHSFSGENLLELQCHGGRAIFEKISQTISPFARLAMPGEFSYRAMLHGKISLHEAESINDLVHAETDNQRKYALYHMEKAYAEHFDSWRTILLQTLAHIEACLDFSDEDIPESTWRNALKSCENLRNILQKIVHSKRGERLKNGIRIALLGLPNAGKSTLLNTICARNVALVHEEAGTTRDVIETTLDINGYAVILMDVAGLRETHNAVEQQGIAKALQAADMADIRLLLHAGTRYEQDKEALQKWLNSTGHNAGQYDMPIITKYDETALNIDGVLSISAQTGYNMDILYKKIEEACAALTPNMEDISLSHARQKQCVAQAITYIDEALQEQELELVAENLRSAVQAISQLTGHVHSEEILDVLFKDFCIGK